MKQKREKLNFY